MLKAVTAHTKGHNFDGVGLEVQSLSCVELLLGILFPSLPLANSHIAPVASFAFLALLLLMFGNLLGCSFIGMLSDGISQSSLLVGTEGASVCDV